jgi:hypothetical protein
LSINEQPEPQSDWSADLNVELVAADISAGGVDSSLAVLIRLADQIEAEDIDPPELELAGSDASHLVVPAIRNVASWYSDEHNDPIEAAAIQVGVAWIERIANTK